MPVTLTKYKDKRKFDKTPEPEGKVEKSKGTLRFVVQKHDASHLHYDFRLEMEGVLKSWAVPKGPSLNPEDKRLAMMVEDHPLEYGKFEGIIPEGNYGAGTVMVWDEGTYHALETPGTEEAGEKALLKGLKSGNIKFVLEGTKLKGEFTLVKIRSNTSKGNEWLLIKKKDKHASAKDVTAKDKSVLSKRSLMQIQQQSGTGKSVWHSSRIKGKEEPLKKKVPELRDKALPQYLSHEVAPMLATLVDKAFDSDQWLFEVKWDGYRAIAEVNQHDVNIYSRNKLSFNEAFSQVAEALKSLSIDAVLDGEIAALDKNGFAKFQLLQNFKRTGIGNIVYYVFDLLSLNGKDLRDLPLLERKKLLQNIIPENHIIRYNDHVIADGIAFYEASVKQDIEGIIAKRITSIYSEGIRTKDWVKIKTHKRQEAVIAGYTKARGGRKFFGALVLGIYKNKKLVYAGHTGGGFTQALLKETFQALTPLIRPTCPFEEVPKTNMPVTWVEPKLLCEVKFQEWTDDGHMRVPIFLGLRTDKNPTEVKAENEAPIEKILKEKKPAASPKKNKKTRVEKEEAPKKKKENSPSPQSKSLKLPGETNEAIVSVDGHSLKITNLKKLYWDDPAYTKQDLIEYYDKIAPIILPYLKDRPENLKRNPNGYKDPGFFQKDMPETLPDWIETIKIYSESNDEYLNYMVCQNKASLLYMANLGCIELNPWLSRKKSIGNPDYIVIDLDPQDVGFDEVMETALCVKSVLDKAGVTGYPKTSGSRGIHIYIPLGAKYDYDQARQFAEVIASFTHGLLPDLTSMERSPAKRKHKVYLDFLQNRTGQTLAAPYCVRPRAGATVSTPLLWSEIKPGLSPAMFDIKNIFKRIEKKGDLFKEVLTGNTDVSFALKKLQS
jgi:bifunctional non-homologous end joining protein LigD